jgi:hypothetical protein
MDGHPCEDTLAPLAVGDSGPWGDTLVMRARRDFLSNEPTDLNYRTRTPEIYSQQ